MRISDILGTSLVNLWRRKTRTLLTVLGVIIGTTSIVVMLSLGIGLKAATMEQVSSSGTLTEISVYNDSFGESSQNLLLDDSTIDVFMDIEHVESVEPCLAFDMPIQVGRYEAYTMISGVSADALSEIALREGDLPKSASANLELVAGNQTVCDFYDWSTGEYPFYEKGELVQVDLLTASVVGGLDLASRAPEEEGQSVGAIEEGTFDPTFSEGFSDSDVGDEQEAIPQDNLSLGNGEEIETTESQEGFSYSSFNANTKRVPVKIVGVTEGDENTYTRYSYNYYADLDQLKKFIKDNYKENMVVPGQPVDKSGKPYHDLKYSNMIVNVDEADNVEAVLQTIQEMGYRADANKEWLEEVEKQFMIIEAVLGGIGGVAMLVAAISIANTMTMSTYERTKEIGVMKVLGCSLSNIRAMFLTEAAFIGFFGGIVGIGLSAILSKVVNRFAPALVASELGVSEKISVIPLWLVLMAIGFSTIIGMLAGFFPAQRATKLSPLNAIRNE